MIVLTDEYFEIVPPIEPVSTVIPDSLFVISMVCVILLVIKLIRKDIIPVPAYVAIPALLYQVWFWGREFNLI